MCKILTGVKKSAIKVKNRKFKHADYHLMVAYHNGLIQISNLNSTNTSVNHPNEEDYDSNVAKHKREKSRVAAKNRRDMESENLTKLYLSLPVAPESRLLNCEDDHFIGYFEKTTIIKVSAYVLKLYNSLIASNQLSVRNYPPQTAVSLFSESIIGLFWCENTRKVVFATPGLARLTGLHWCNIIGMPIDSIIIDASSLEQDGASSRLIFLRFMVNPLKDRGIFTVQTPPKGSPSQSSDSEEKKPASNQMIGKMACSVWGTGKLANGLRFAILQTLTSKSESLVFIRSDGSSPDKLPTDDRPERPPGATSKGFSIYFQIETYGTLAVDAELFNALGFVKEELDESNIYSFFYLEDIFTIINDMKEIMADNSKIKRNFARICTIKKGVYRSCRYTLQVNGEREVTIPNIFNSRSTANQGEAYSQSVIEALSLMDQGPQMHASTEDGMQTAYIHLQVMLLSYFYEEGYEPIYCDSDPEFDPECDPEVSIVDKGAAGLEASSVYPDCDQCKLSCSLMHTDCDDEAPCTSVSLGACSSECGMRPIVDTGAAGLKASSVYTDWDDAVPDTSASLGAGSSQKQYSENVLSRPFQQTFAFGSSLNPLDNNCKNYKDPSIMYTRQQIPPMSTFALETSHEFSREFYNCDLPRYAPMSTGYPDNMLPAVIPEQHSLQHCYEFEQRHALLAPTNSPLSQNERRFDAIGEEQETSILLRELMKS